MNEQTRRKSNRERLLETFQAHPRTPLANIDLQKVGGMRYNSRIFELRKQFRIETGPCVNGIVHYTYYGPRDEPQPESPLLPFQEIV